MRLRVAYVRAWLAGATAVLTVAHDAVYQLVGDPHAHLHGYRSALNGLPTLLGVAAIVYLALGPVRRKHWVGILATSASALLVTEVMERWVGGAGIDAQVLAVSLAATVALFTLILSIRFVSSRFNPRRELSVNSALAGVVEAVLLIEVRSRVRFMRTSRGPPLLVR